MLRAVEALREVRAEPEAALCGPRWGLGGAGGRLVYVCPQTSRRLTGFDKGSVVAPHAKLARIYREFAIQVYLAIHDA